MHWYLVHTKPIQEKCSLENLQRQGYQCYLPPLSSKKLRQGVIMVTDEPLFPGYLFIRLGQGDTAQSWAPIRSTRGVSRMVSFEIRPAKVSGSLVEALRTQEASTQVEPEHLFKSGERVRLTDAPFASNEGIDRMADDKRRVMVLLELLSKQVSVQVPSESLCKVG